MPERGARLRVLHILGPSAGGIGRHVGELARRQACMGHSVSVLGPAGSVPDALGLQGGGVEVKVAPVGRMRSLLAAVRAIRHHARLVDVVHAHGLTAGWTTVVARLSLPTVLTVHNVVLPEVSLRATPLLRLAEASLPARVDRTIAISADVARRFAGRPGAGRIDVVAPVGPVPVPDRPPSIVRAELGLADHTTLVVLVGRLHPQKDVGTFLRAVALMVRRGFGDLLAVVVGDGPDRTSLERQRDELGLADRVRFVGPRPSAAAEMVAAQVVVCSSMWESFGFVVAEALLLGRPVVATAVGRIPEMVIDGETGRLVPPGDPHALACAIADLVEDPQGSVMAERGRARVRAIFDPDVLAEEVLDTYRKAGARV